MKALPTAYKGIVFRSRTEARWAVFFDALAISWQYEPEGFGLQSGNYLPDFYLPDLGFDFAEEGIRKGLWFEVKPDWTDGNELSRFGELCAKTCRDGIIARGPPQIGRKNLHYFGDGLRLCKGDGWDGPFEFLQDRRDDRIYWLSNEDIGCFSIGGPGECTDHDRYPAPAQYVEGLRAAFELTSAQRFGT